MTTKTYRKVPKVTTFDTFGFIATFGRSLPSVAETCTVQGPFKITVTISRQMWKIHTFYLQKLLSYYCFEYNSTKRIV